MDDVPPLPESLQEMVSAYALQFGWRLLARGYGDALDYEVLVDAAQEMVTEAPEQAAMFLAGLVAQDMLRVAASARPSREPGRN